MGQFDPFDSVDGEQAVLRGKRLTIQDDDGVDIAYFGKLPDGTYGFYFTPTEGVIPLLQFSNVLGQRFPGIETPLVPSNSDTVSFTSGTFLGVFERHLDVAFANAFHVYMGWATPSGVTGEVRVRNNVAGGATSSVITLPANSGGYAEFRWLHQQEVGTGPFWPVIEARRTAGASPITFWAPLFSRQVDGSRISATTSGV